MSTASDDLTNTKTTTTTNRMHLQSVARSCPVEQTYRSNLVWGRIVGVKFVK